MRKCDLCDSCVDSARTYLAVDGDELAMANMADLNNCLLDAILNERVPKCHCGGDRTLIQSDFGDVVLIDMSLRIGIKQYSLSEIPGELNFFDIMYDAYACIELIGHTTGESRGQIAGRPLGHYRSHILRSHKRWECYDDMKSKVSYSHVNTKINGQVLVYAKRK